MGGRRRISAGATLAVVVATACGVVTACSADAPDPTVSPVSTAPVATSATTTPSTTTSAASATTSSTSSTTSTSTVACGAVDIVVLGNSTDYWPNYVVGADAPSDEAWPSALEERLRADLSGTRVSVVNGSVLGAGFDIGLYGVTSMSDQLEQLTEQHADGSAVLLLAPSVVDLQLRSLDVDASYDAFERLYADATTAFATVLVLPMNPVATGTDLEVARAVAAFNERLVAAGVVAVGDRSPLLSDDDLFGRAEYYDGFDDGRLDTPGPDPDGLHPDVDGHAVIADAVARRVVAAVPVVCS